MFRFFAALAKLTANTEALANTFAEANTNLRANLGMDAPPERLEGPTNGTENESDSRSTKNGRKPVASR